MTKRLVLTSSLWPQSSFWIKCDNDIFMCCSHTGWKLCSGIYCCDQGVAFCCMWPFCCPVSHHLSVELNFILCICRRHNSKATAGSYCKGLLCALKSNYVHFCLKFFLFVVVNFLIVKYVLFRCREFIYSLCLKKS